MKKNLSAVEWKMMASLSKILQPMYRATLFVQQRNAGISCVLPLFNVLCKKLLSGNE